MEIETKIKNQINIKTHFKLYWLSFIFSRLNNTDCEKKWKIKDAPDEVKRVYI